MVGLQPTHQQLEILERARREARLKVHGQIDGPADRAPRQRIPLRRRGLITGATQPARFEHRDEKQRVGRVGL